MERTSARLCAECA